MDGAAKSNRKFPAYTLAELKAKVAVGTASQEIKDEIAARESGKSVALVVPQIEATLI